MRGSALVNRLQVSPNFEPRLNDLAITLVVLHYTGMASGSAAVDWLCNPQSKVSCHYLVDVDGSIVQMVDEQHRAWHAGVSSWFSVIDNNSASIGIEIQNTGHAGGLPTFPDAQMQRVADLCLDIMVRHNLSPQQVVAHSDIAPGRKVDPGEAFDWNYLASRGVGQVVSAGRGRGEIALATDAQHQLQLLGYAVEVTGEYDHRTRIVVEALQRRYRRRLVDGVVDAETFDVLRRLNAIMPSRLVT